MQALIIALASFALLFTGCGVRKQELSAQPKSSETAQPAESPVQPPTQTNDTRPVIVAFGDSLTAGYGVEPGLSYPDYLQKELDRLKLRYQVVNQGVSGDTTTDGLNRVNDVLAAKPAIVIVEFGGNDGLRGLPLETTRTNLDQILDQITHSGPKAILAGMTLPPNYGPEYIRPFEKLYIDLAAKYKVPRIRFLLEGVGGNPALMQRDGLHATSEGNAIVARNVLKTLQPLLR